MCIKWQFSPTTVVQTRLCQITAPDDPSYSETFLLIFNNILFKSCFQLTGYEETFLTQETLAGFLFEEA